jgi:DNA sulfur modification protein DndE
MGVQLLSLRRVRFSKEADNWLRVLKSRTGITPNLLCRIALCLSLEEPGNPDPSRVVEDSDREINRYTLLGEHDGLFVALLRQRLAEEGLPTSTGLDECFRAHLHRGIQLLSGRLKSLGDLGDLVPRATV